MFSLYSIYSIYFKLEPETYLITPVSKSSTLFRSGILALALQILYIYHFTCKFTTKTPLTNQSFQLSIRPSSHSTSSDVRTHCNRAGPSTRSDVTVTSVSARMSFVLSSKHAPTQQHFALPCLRVQFSANRDWYETDTKMQQNLQHQNGETWSS